MIDGNYDGNVPVSNNIGRALLALVRTTVVATQPIV
jgi:hypothetical protein